MAALSTEAGAQMVSGSVVSAATGAPVTGAMVVITAAADSTDRQITNTDGRGEFLLAGLAPGEYSLLIRKIGFGAILVPSRVLKAGETWTSTYGMTPVITVLDTVRSRAQSDLTPGSQWFLKHYRAGKGFFTSGKEILLSRVDACTYFSRVPGLRISTVTPPYEDFGGLRCSDGRYVVLDTDYSCLRTYVDRIWTISQIDSSVVQVRTGEADYLARTLRNKGVSEQASDTLPRPLPLEQIAGIEVFRNLSEVPKDFSIPLYREPDAPFVRQLPGQREPSKASAPTTRPVPADCGVMLVWSYRAW